MSSASDLKFFSTTAHQCSYLPDEQATTLFADPKSSLDLHVYSELSDLGFRRSGNYIYRPHCGACRACVPVRIPVAQFKPNRQQKRVWSRNQDIEVVSREAGFDPEHYALYEEYIAHRHYDGDMYPPSVEQYTSFLTSEWSQTTFFEFRLEGRLLAVSVCDWLENGLSAVYTFYAPEEQARSLGTYAVLWQIQECAVRGLHAVYLGYWIKQCRKMSYKVAFRPIEVLVNSEWLLAR